ncbi:hypothetical protein DYB31_015777 [Aphanomyces astaci]|uniref:Peptidase S1 domain-containing protein n=1 Tax=Aphanomyces astaci TaxID=112090 RepID=A0A397FXZ1_APHAT|nr:hypothetical protein DYB31_015777 [Aphanomyces astaci]
MVSPLQLIAAASSVAATAASPLDGRIINGTVAPIGKHLFVTGLRATEVGQSICGAALIAPKVLLTSASCLKSYFAFASVGSHYLQGNVDGERIKIVKKTAPPMKIAAPVKVAFDDDEYAPPNTIAWVRGWGLNATNSNQFSQVLLQADVPIWDQAACAVANGSMKLRAADTRAYTPGMFLDAHGGPQLASPTTNSSAPFHTCTRDYH